MRGLYAVYRKEMGHYFVSPVAYIVVGVFLLLSAYFFNSVLIRMYQQAIEMELRTEQFGPPPPIDVTMSVTREFFDICSTLLLFLSPMLTMGVYSEERKRGTMELLMTSPVTETQIVSGQVFCLHDPLLAIMLGCSPFSLLSLCTPTATRQRLGACCGAPTWESCCWGPCCCLWARFFLRSRKASSSPPSSLSARSCACGSLISARRARAELWRGRSPISLFLFSPLRLVHARCD